MGPYLFITRPGPITTFHKDGFGSVDSGHLCLSGYNEIIMFPSLADWQEKKVLEICGENAKSAFTEPHETTGVSFISSEPFVVVLVFILSSHIIFYVLL